MTLPHALMVEPYDGIRIFYPIALESIAEVTALRSPDEALAAIIRDPTKYCFISTACAIGPDTHAGLDLLGRIHDFYVRYNLNHSKQRWDPVRVLTSTYLSQRQYPAVVDNVRGKGAQGIIIQSVDLSFWRDLVRAAGEGKPHQEIEKMLLEQGEAYYHRSNRFNPGSLVLKED